MKTLNILFICFALFVTGKASAHSVWIESDPAGKQGETHLVKLFFGEYAKNKREKVDARFNEVKDFSLWVISPSGKQIFLECKPKETYYQSSFIPAENGIYTILFENKLRDVADWRNTSGKLGILKQNYYASTKVNIGNTALKSDLAFTDLQMTEKSGDQGITIKATYQGKTLPGVPVILRSPGDEEKILVTNDHGEVRIKDYPKGLYVLTILLRFNNPGTFKGITYEGYREKATYSLYLN